METLASTPGIHAVVPLANNFLVPNATFIAEVIAFALIIWVLARYIIPPINAAMTARQEAIRKQFADLEAAEGDARKAEADYKEQLNNAKHEAARIREEAASRAPRSSRTPARRPRPRPSASSSTPTPRSRRTGRRRSRPCGATSAAWPPPWPGGSSASPWTS